MNSVAVVGGGAAGLLAAGIAARFSDKVTLFDRNEKLGKKLYITGKGRCNFTNVVPPNEFLNSVVRNPKFLFGAINRFTPYDAVELIEEQGIKTKVERGNRAFPLSDKASDITKALTALCREGNVEFRLGTYIGSVSKNNETFELTSTAEKYFFGKVILACGGMSYPSTGSDGNGYELARKLGHKITEPRVSLVDIKLYDEVKELEGLSLKNVSAKIELKDKSFSESGEMLFTDDGVSGPIILTLSSYISRFDLKGALLKIDLKPALDVETLDKRILSDFKSCQNKFFKNALDELLPGKLIPFIVKRSGISPLKPVNSVTREERQSLVNALKSLTFEVKGLGGFDRAVVTSGGVDVREVNPKTMESKIVSGLYFAGEMLDIDALTGGFNIQIAFSTGYVAGLSAGGG